ncbi:MAG: hypothetical protein SFX74_12985 [Fimbriimonadaceae bacterium]|nr:hypothetical protein [Fimbriimonadaceae bacterium]
MAMDADGNVVFQGQSGSANLSSTPENRLRKNLSHATEGCPPPSFVCGCFAGLINRETRSKGLEQLRAVFPAAEVRAEPDYTAALYAAPPETDVLIISGTGSLVCSRTESGIKKSGGRGYMLGDEGSAYQFGRESLRHFLAHPDRASEALRSQVETLFNGTEESEIIPQIYKSATPAATLAKLAKAFSMDVRAREPYALAALDRHLEQLLDVVTLHVDRHLNPEQPHLDICLSGGVWKGSPIFKDRFTELATARFAPRTLNIHRIARPPLYGAVQLAREMHHGN